MLLALALLTLADPGPALGTARLPAGVERVYAGTAEEVGRGVLNPFRKRHELEVRLLVLDSHPGGADVAVLTRVWPLADPVVAGPAAALTGRDVPTRGDPSVRLDLIRVDPRGRVGKLSTSPFTVGPSAASAPLPDGPPDRLPVVETGFFVPLPPRPVRPGDGWTDGTDPPTLWTVGDEVGWNGAAAVVVTGVRQTAGFDTPATALTGWRRADTLTVPPADGFAVVLERAVQRREGGAVVGELRVRYEQKSAGRLSGRLLEEVRREAEAACKFAADLAPLLAQGPRADPRLVRQRLVAVRKHLDDGPARGPFREAVEAVRAGGEGLLKR